MLERFDTSDAGCVSLQTTGRGLAHRQLGPRIRGRSRDVSHARQSLPQSPNPLPHRIASFLLFFPQRHLTDALESHPCLFPQAEGLLYPTEHTPGSPPQPRNFGVGRRTQSARRFRSTSGAPDFAEELKRKEKKFLRYYSFWGRGLGIPAFMPNCGVFAISLRLRGYSVGGLGYYLMFCVRGAFAASFFLGVEVLRCRRVGRAGEGNIAIFLRSTWTGGLSERDAGLQARSITRSPISIEIRNRTK